MRNRVLLSVPVLIVLGLAADVRAQVHSWGAGIGVWYGYGYGPVWGIYPTYYQGFYGNGLSMYGPPVPTGKPIPGVFGGGDSAFFDLPPIYPGWLHAGCTPLGCPGPMPPTLFGPPAPGGVLLPPALAKPCALEVEVRLPCSDARFYIDGTESKGSGTVRHFRTPEVGTAQTYNYDLRAEWTVDGLTTTHAKRVIGRAGERVVVDFTK
ncbi:MAG TPA: TIGR03000 domain-containing protein [Gemmataceae bacterium]|nr:TIGR03000 domain-containing protein [Gemmataceae bacterium]